MYLYSWSCNKPKPLVAWSRKELCLPRHQPDPGTRASVSFPGTFAQAGIDAERACSVGRQAGTEQHEGTIMQEWLFLAEVRDTSSWSDCS